MNTNFGWKRRYIVRGLNKWVRFLLSTAILYAFTWTVNAQPKTATEPYVLGPSDVMEITAAPGGDPAQTITRRVTVRPDGNISFDYVGAISVNGLTPEQVDTVLTKRLQEFIKDVEISVQVTEFNAMRIFVVGEVPEPGQFILASKMTVLDAIALAGTCTNNASLRKVKVVRPSRKKPRIIIVDMKKLIHSGDARQNIYLEDGDIVVVSANGWAKIGNAFNKVLLPFREVVGYLVAAVVISSLFN